MKIISGYINWCNENSGNNLEDPEFIAWRDARIDILHDEFEKYQNDTEEPVEDPKIKDFDQWAWREWVYRINRKDIYGNQ